MNAPPDAAETPTLRCPRARIHDRRSPLSSRHQPRPSLPASYPMPRCYASRRGTSMTRRRRSPCACSRRRPTPPVRCAPPQRGASIVTLGAPSRICPGRRIACPCSCASANGFAAIAPVRAASSRNACPPWLPPGRGARCGSRRACSPSAGRLGGRLGCSSATRGTWW